MMFLRELYYASDSKEKNKKVSLQKLVEDSKNNTPDKNNICKKSEIRFSQRGMVTVSEWNIKKLTERKQ